MAPLEFLKNAGDLVYSQASFFFGTCEGRRSNFLSSPSACRCALSDFARFFAMSIVAPQYTLDQPAFCRFGNSGGVLSGVENWWRPRKEGRKEGNCPIVFKIDHPVHRFWGIIFPT